MAKVATCANGHNFDPDVYDACPYCPKNHTGENPTTAFNLDSNMKTQLVDNFNTRMDRGSEKTQIQNEAYQSPEKAVPVQGTGARDNNAFVHKGTVIVTPDDKSRTTNRRLAGFLVSYDVAQHGESFKVFDGKNLIGSDPVSEIVISNDPGVSGKHLTILFRGGVFRFKDEFSTNGTYVNGKMMEEGNLNDKYTRV